MTHLTKRALGVLLTIAALGGCAMEAADSPDGIDEVGVVPGGKADGGDYSACELRAVVDWINGGVSADDIKGAGVHRRAAENIVERRDGTDGQYGTVDDEPFEDIEAVDRVRYVGTVAIRQLVAAVADRCATSPSVAEVIMSPQLYGESHLARIASLIDGAERSIDVAMYSYSDPNIREALGRASSRGVAIRFIFDGASADRTAPAGTPSAALEDMGIEVRWVNKIMHHKFAIIDGARTELTQASGGTLVTGSGNWSNSAATRYDENTLIVPGNVELNLRYQREFNHLWDNGRLVVWNETIEQAPHLAIADSDIVDDASVDAVFTSANFSVSDSTRYGPTFSVIRGENEIADTWVSLIQSARRSIRIASGHLRSRAVAEALVAARNANPELDVRVYLDDQEYLSESSHDSQVRDLNACLAAATTDAAVQNCNDRGFLFGYQMHLEGIALRYKYYAYRWDYSYAPQMHHKYMVIDEEILVTGSYNLSDNAEHNTMENDSVLRGPAFQNVIDAYVDNFDQIWVTGEESGLYESLLDTVQNGTGTFPIVFDAMALDWDRVTALKNAIRTACPLINSPAFRNNAAAHRYCSR